MNGSYQNEKTRNLILNSVLLSFIMYETSVVGRRLSILERKLQPSI